MSQEEGVRVVELVHEEAKRYQVNVSESIAKAKKQLEDKNVKAVQLYAVGQDISRVSLIAIRLEEEAKCKITRMVTDQKVEKGEGGEKDKTHMVLRIRLERGQKEEVKEVKA